VNWKASNRTDVATLKYCSLLMQTLGSQAAIAIPTLLEYSPLFRSLCKLSSSVPYLVLELLVPLVGVRSLSYFHTLHTSHHKYAVVDHASDFCCFRQHDRPRSTPTPWWRKTWTALWRVAWLGWCLDLGAACSWFITFGTFSRQLCGGITVRETLFRCLNQCLEKFGC